MTDVRLGTRFWAKVDLSAGGDGCWPWTGALSSGGYGRFSVSGKNNPAHRVAYELANGPVPDGLTIDHLCRNRRCVNPRHMEPVEMRVNTLRGVGPTAINASKESCKNGHPLTEDNLCAGQGGRRRCRICQRDNDRAYRRGVRAAVIDALKEGEPDVR